MEYYSAIKRMKYCHLQLHDGPTDYHTKQSKEKKRQRPPDITYMWNLMTRMNRSMKQKYIHRYRKQTCGCQGGGAWERDGVRGWG